MAGETLTPNIGLQVAGFNQANWQTPTNYNWFLLDMLLAGVLSAGTFVPEEPTGTVPGSAYTLSHAPGILIAFYVNGLFQRPGIDYTVAGNVVTLGYSTSSGDTVYAVYFY